MALGKRLKYAEIALKALSDNEIDQILASLEKYNCLDKLAGTPFEYRKSHFKELADKVLLVALRELTSRSSFDEIVKNEYDQVPTDLARHAYIYVSVLGQIGLSLRYEHLIRILDLRYDQLGSEVFKATDGVLIQGEAVGGSRHAAGFRLSTRHPIIASIVFATAAPTDSAKFKVINDIITQLDPGYIEDSRLLEEMVRHKEIVNTLESPDIRRAVYDRLEDVLPSNPYVLQHRSILERELGDSEASIICKTCC